MNIADLDYSANANFGMRQVSCVLPVYLSHVKRTRKDAHQTMPFRVSRETLKYPQGPLQKKFCLRNGDGDNIADLD